MSVDDITLGDDKELYRRGLGFLKQARDLRGLPPAAFQCIERRIERLVARPRRRPLLLAAATLAIVLLAGTAFAVAHVGLRRLPFVGPLFAPRASQPMRPSSFRRAFPRQASTSKDQAQAGAKHQSIRPGVLGPNIAAVHK